MFSSKVFQNAKWIIAGKIIQSVIQLIVGMLTARYLGPSNYGLINYAASIVAFFVPVMQLGLQATLVQEYVDTPQQEGKIIGTQLVMNMVAAVACMIGVVSFAAVANAGETTTIIVCALYSASMFFQAIEMLQYWFQSRLKSKYSSLAMLGAYIVVSAYKIYLLVFGKSVYWFAFSHAVEYGVTGLLLLLAYKRVGTQKISFSGDILKRMYSKSKHYIVAMLMVVVYGRIGSILLTQIFGETENGFYAAAVTCVAITNFVFLAIIDSARPVVLESLKESHEAFEKNVSRVYALTTWLSLAQSVGFTLFAGLVVKVLYGEEYLPTIPVLQILVWNSAFSYMGYVRNIWILGEQKHNVLWIINLCGAVASVLLNVLLIPVWGACGAAVASVATQIFTNFIMGYILKPIRRNNYLIIKGLNPMLVIEMIKMVVKKSAPNA